MDILDTKQAENVYLLRSSIGWQTPKYSGKIYVSAFLATSEIIQMEAKGEFYLTSFYLGSTDPHGIFWNPPPVS